MSVGGGCCVCSIAFPSEGDSPTRRHFKSAKVMIPLFYDVYVIVRALLKVSSVNVRIQF